MVCELYAFYASMVKKQTPTKAKEFDQPPVLTTLVREIMVDLLEENVRRVLYGPTFQQTAPTDKFDHRMQNVWYQNMMKDPTQIEMLMRWIANHISM